MSEEQSINIDSRKLFNMGVNILVAGFIRQKPEDAKKLFRKMSNTTSYAKKLFKELKQGNQVQSGELTAKESGTVIPIKLELDRSEYCGQFNYPNFDISLRTMLEKFETEARKDKDLKDLRTLTNEATGGLLFNLPAGVQIGEDLNVLMMAVEPLDEHLIVKLMFMNPKQFQA